MNNIPFIKLLLVEDDTADAELLVETLSILRYVHIDIVRSSTLTNALVNLNTYKFDIIIADLGLPDAQGLDTFIRMSEQTPEVPIIMLTGQDDEELAMRALKLGAQDYLVKGQIDNNVLYRSIRYSIERHRLIQQLKTVSITDELTGLYNRRGFMMLANKQIELASRVNRTMWLMYFDIDNMKWINDTFGHEEGDNAIKDTATLLQQTFRKSDVIARIGGDEFAVVSLEYTKMGTHSMRSRIMAEIRSSPSKETRGYQLSVSVGAVSCDAGPDCDVSALLSLADKIMYEEKIAKRR